jgi:hypothetical protein
MPEIEKRLRYRYVVFISVLYLIVFVPLSVWLTSNNSAHSGGHGGTAYLAGLRVALIKPTFTSAAYRDSFYRFYRQYDKTSAGRNITRDLNLLSSKVSDDITESSSRSVLIYLEEHLDELLPKKSRIDILTDVDVDNSGSYRSSPFSVSSAPNIFSENDKKNAYDIIILGHQEYVTQREYDNLKRFVMNGGVLIILDGNIFYAEVKYDRNSETITLVKGHHWAFNGKSAWKSVAERWSNETSQWIGSNYLCYSCKVKFTTNPFGYHSHEEQYITNTKDIILMNYGASLSTSVPSNSNSNKSLISSSSSSSSPFSSSPSSSPTLLSQFLSVKDNKHHSHHSSKPIVVASYMLKYLKGKVIVLGIYSNDIITNGKFRKYLDNVIL